MADIENLNITKSATEKGDKKTFKVTAEIPQAGAGEFEVTYGVVTKGEELDSLFVEMLGESRFEGGFIEYDIEVVEKIERGGKTDKKYSSIPQGVIWETGTEM